ncbi:RWD domain-containing protein [Sphaerosporella brunnea]|uniref:RBR-type E3 ubiquitin transferase n=1 Tax=Sphaerosporella brunnea TaxID=1250544 RepID=A0A5J5F8J6_9PEZI|nr:RWD domain-containing protein [Sphaerosporella brunnea]
MPQLLTHEALSESDDERAQELGTIASIFPEELTILTFTSGILNLAVTPLQPLATTSPSSGETPVLLEHLPPVKLQFSLPEAYPAAAPPTLELSTTPAWLLPEKLSAITQQCLDLWEELGHGQVVWAIVDHLQQCAERAFDVAAPFCVSDELHAELVEFNEKTKHEIFNKGTYDCGICLEPKKGTVCHALRSCGHVFCRPCLRDYYVGLIKEGDVNSVRCSDRSCVKSSTRPPPTQPPDNPDDPEAAQRAVALASLPATLPPEELTDIGVPADLVTRYVAMKKKKALEKDPNTIYCAQKWCQAPSRASVELLEETMKRNGSGYWLPDRGATPAAPAKKPKTAEEGQDHPSPLREKLQVCSVCSFAFCRVCLASWHGDFQICKSIDGKLTKEELANEEYLRLNTTPCPTCQSPVIKSHGCNHMICACDTHFCFLCSAYLAAENPYVHFNTRGTECFQRLWEGEEGDLENHLAWPAEMG